MVVLQVVSKILRSEYQTLLDIVHVAGTKSFSTTALQETLDLNISLVAEIPFKYLYLDDVVETDDQVSKFVTLPKTDATNQSTDNATILFTKQNDDSAILSDDINSFAVSKEIIDTTTVDDTNIEKEKVITIADAATAFQVDISTSYNEEAYFDEDYAVTAAPSDFEATLT